MAGELPPPNVAATLGIKFLAGELFQGGERIASATATAIIRKLPS